MRGEATPEGTGSGEELFHGAIRIRKSAQGQWIFPRIRANPYLPRASCTARTARC